MKKKEAIKSMKEGKRVTHQYFSKNEWMTLKNGMIETEDGYNHYPFEFWKYRLGDGWKDGYSLFN